MIDLLNSHAPQHDLRFSARRACQIFYELKGGTVCYGQEHSRVHGHACHGETLVGKFPAWGEDRPIHIVGHSYGGQTARVLQHLVAIGEGLF